MYNASSIWRHAKLSLSNSLPAAVTQETRMMILATAREEYMNIIPRLRMKQTQKAVVPKALSAEIEYGDKVLVYRETTKNMGAKELSCAQ